MARQYMGEWIEKQKPYLLLLLTFILMNVFASKAYTDVGATRVYIAELLHWSYDNKGVAIELFDSFDPSFRRKFMPITLPLKRIINGYHRTIENDIEACYIGESKDNVEKLGFNINRIYSNPITVTDVVALTLKQEKIIRNWEELQDKNIGIIRGLSLDIFSQQKIKNITKVNTLQSLYGMLKNQRLDVVISFFPDAKELLVNTHHDFTFVINRYYDTFHCENTEAGRYNVEQFNTQLSLAINDRRYEAILKKHWSVTSEYLILMKGLSGK
ncbi:hypothetical protein [Zooshikella sp. RANM57]|uniref:hypothetical protein n=1 Tax=Zooshikella sp. RANM57 TaxID=3425863 RepID=UPI003D6F9D53